MRHEIDPAWESHPRFRRCEASVFGHVAIMRGTGCSAPCVICGGDGDSHRGIVLRYEIDSFDAEERAAGRHLYTLLSAPDFFGVRPCVICRLDQPAHGYGIAYTLALNTSEILYAAAEIVRNRVIPFYEGNKE